MIEGWYNELYYVLFNEEEISSVSQRYGIAEWLPGFEVLGLQGWDDFVVRDQAGRHFTVPTVPIDPKHLIPCNALPLRVELRPDVRFAGKIKWYIKPLVFGGDPRLSENLTWVDPDEHAQLVQWWNQRYRVIKTDLNGR